jgi:hypothetical protein
VKLLFLLITLLISAFAQVPAARADLACLRYFIDRDPYVFFRTLNVEPTQFTIWDLAKKGSKEKAQELEIEVAFVLENKEPLKIFPLSSHPGVQVFEFENGIKGIFKKGSGEKEHAGSEVTTYLIDRMLGLDIVPITVFRKHGEEIGSLQLFVESDGRAYRGRAFKKAKDFPEGESLKIDFLDYLIRNTDRHIENALFNKTRNKLIAIDHGYSLGNPNRAYGKPPAIPLSLFQTKEGAEIFARLKALNNTELHRKFDPLIGESAARGFISRKGSAIKAIETSLAETP